MFKVHIAILLHHVFCIAITNRAQRIFHSGKFSSFAILLGIEIEALQSNTVILMLQVVQLLHQQS